MQCFPDLQDLFSVIVYADLGGLLSPDITVHTIYSQCVWQKSI